MGLKWPRNPSQINDGDDHSFAPEKSKESLLATERGSDATRRLETDADRNLFVNVGANSALPAGVDTLATGSQVGVGANLLTTIVTYTAPAAKSITRISVSGTEYAKYQLFKNASLIETKRTGPDRSTEFVFNSPLVMSSGDILDVKVTHFYTGNTLDVESSIYGA